VLDVSSNLAAASAAFFFFFACIKSFGLGFTEGRVLGMGCKGPEVDAAVSAAFLALRFVVWWLRV